MQVVYYLLSRLHPSYIRAIEKEEPNPLILLFLLLHLPQPEPDLSDEVGFPSLVGYPAIFDPRLHEYLLLLDI